MILVTGDAYVDASHMGVSVVGRVLMDEGYRVGIIAQPDLDKEKEITRLGAPALFWGVTGGAVDSMVANYTALHKRRKSDDLTAGGINDRRPDRAVIVYSNLIRRYFKRDTFIVIGGIEASLRRISHYDAWSDRVRRSILFDARADVLVYGMGEETVLALARKRDKGESFKDLRGICYISGDVPAPLAGFSDVPLPSHQEVSESKARFARMFLSFYENTDPVTGNRLYQKQDTRYLVQNPPARPLSREALDRVHELPYARDAHPFYKTKGSVKALDTIRFSLTTHRGCYGECRFCAITVHQGRHVTSRSHASILREALGFSKDARFKGVITNVGGPTANMYGIECERKKRQGACEEKGCLYPGICKHLPVHHGPQTRLLKALLALPRVKKVFVGSGIRYDLILRDRQNGESYLENIIRHHLSGQMKIAPEHVSDPVLRLMGKPGTGRLEDFLEMFNRLKQKAKKNVFLTYYLMAAHPGCTLEQMKDLKKFARKTLLHVPEQVQIFTPTPGTCSTLMYYGETDPFTGEKIFVEKRLKGKRAQKSVIIERNMKRGGKIRR